MDIPTELFKFDIKKMVLELAEKLAIEENDYTFLENLKHNQEKVEWLKNEINK